MLILLYIFMALSRGIFMLNILWRVLWLLYISVYTEQAINSQSWMCIRTPEQNNNSICLHLIWFLATQFQQMKQAHYWIQWPALIKKKMGWINNKSIRNILRGVILLHFQTQSVLMNFVNFCQSDTHGQWSEEKNWQIIASITFIYYETSANESCTQ